MNGVRASWERFRQRLKDAPAEAPGDRWLREHEPWSYGLVWAGLGFLFGMALGGIVPNAPDQWNLDGAVKAALIGAPIGFALGVTISALAMPRGRRWVALVAGVLLVVVNILPEPAFRGGYYWSSNSRLLLAIGVVLVLFAVLTKPKDESF